MDSQWYISDESMYSRDVVHARPFPAPSSARTQYPPPTARRVERTHPRVWNVVRGFYKERAGSEAELAARAEAVADAVEAQAAERAGPA